MWEEIRKFLADFWDDLADFFIDLFVSVLSMVLEIIGDVVSAIPMPSFMTDFNASDYIGNDIGFFLMMSGVGQALAIVGAGFLFRFLRRVLTLGIW